MRRGFSHHARSALFHEDKERRVLSACVGVSMALHLAALFAFPGLRTNVSAGSSRPLTATFASTLVQPEAGPKLPSRPRREANLERPGPVLAASGLAAADVTLPAQPVPSPAPIPQTAGAAPPAGNASRTPEAPATSSQSTEYSAEAPDAALLEKYRLALIDAARRYKRYPVRALEKGWQGRVEIRVVVGSNGTIKNTIIKRSSSYQILDDQALNMVTMGTRAEPIPSALRGREFALDIPVIFELQAG